ALVLNFKRSASIKVHGRSALLAGIDFHHFSDLNDFTLFSLKTKISFFRMLTTNIRWNLERNKMQHPEHPLEARLRTPPFSHRQKGTLEELHSLHHQAHESAELLCAWNEA